MELGQWILYAAATYFAIRSLVALMQQHRQEYKRKLADDLTANRPAPTTTGGRTATPAKTST